MIQNTIIDSVRAELSMISSNSVTWPTEDLRIYVLDGIAMIHADAPESRLDNRGRILSISEHPYADAAELPLDRMYRNALIQFVLYRCFLKDSEDARDLERARAHFASYQSIVNKGPAQ